MAPTSNAAEGMDSESMRRFINYLMEQKREDDLEKRAMRIVLEELYNRARCRTAEVILKLEL